MASPSAAYMGIVRGLLTRNSDFSFSIEFIEQTVFSLVNQIVLLESTSVTRQAGKVVHMLMQFAEKNPGMTRVMVGDALVLENERLQQRMNLFFDKIEAMLKQCLRGGLQSHDSLNPAAQAQVQASVLTAFVVGRLQRFARSGFRRLPSEHLDASLALILGARVTPGP
jgi:TetR/AcrR family transcriptional regulator